MIRIDRVVTRGGDAGQTSLGDGTRVPKYDRRVEAYGTVDEANAVIGLLRLHTREDAEADAMLARIQNDLFDVGADLCVPGEAGERLRLTRRAQRTARGRGGGDERGAGAADQLRAAGRHAGRGLCPPRPHRRPPCRAGHGARWRTRRRSTRRWSGS